MLYPIQRFCTLPVSGGMSDGIFKCNNTCYRVTFGALLKSVACMSVLGACVGTMFTVIPDRFGDHYKVLDIGLSMIFVSLIAGCFSMAFLSILNNLYKTPERDSSEPRRDLEAAPLRSFTSDVVLPEASK